MTRRIPIQKTRQGRKTKQGFKELTQKHEYSYDFCQEFAMPVEDMLIWLGLDGGLVDDASDDFFGRFMMILDEYCIRISCDKSKFGRWSNSEDMFIDLRKEQDRKDFVSWIKNMRDFE